VHGAALSAIAILTTTAATTANPLPCRCIAGCTDIEILGVGQSIYSITGVLVTPVVGFIKWDVGDLSRLTKNDVEVAAIFTRPVRLLNNPKYISYETYERDGKKTTMPVYGGGDGDLYGITPKEKEKQGLREQLAASSPAVAIGAGADAGRDASVGTDTDTGAGAGTAAGAVDPFKTILFKPSARATANTALEDEEEDDDGCADTDAAGDGGMSSGGYVDLIAPDGNSYRVRQRRIWGLTGLVTQAVLDLITTHDERIIAKSKDGA